MKQGSADDPFADEPTTNQEDNEESEGNGQSTAQSSRPDSVDSNSNFQSKKTEQETANSQPHSLPYIHSRGGVKDGRTQRPVFLRDHIEDGIDELLEQMEEEVGESVYKTDVTEAAMAVAQENPKLVLAKLEEWGYGWE